jgi:hypothetical protein
MKIMTIRRPIPLVLLHVVFASLPGVCMTMAAAVASETKSTETAADAPSTPRRSHIQPVGEVAATSQHSDTLGLRLARASEVLRQQLALARGAGLVVEAVTPGSAAEKAGFKQHDVLVLLDDQMLLLPEQLAALLEAANGNTAPECTLLRGGAKVTIAIGEPRRSGQPSLPTPSKPVGPPTIASSPAPAKPPLPAVRQTAAKPSTSPRLRAPASALALVQPERSGQSTPATMRASASVASPAQSAGRTAAPADETLVRQDSDYQIKLSRGDETRLVVLDPHGRILFNDEIDTPEHRSLVPPAVRQRVDEMEKSLETTTHGPAAEIGRLEVPPIEIR